MKKWNLALSLLCLPALVSAQASHTYTYTYNDNGQVESVDGPRVDVEDKTQFSYYPIGFSNNSGNLSAVVNAKGQVTTYSQYTASGAPAKVVDSRGVTTETAFTAKGRPASITVSGREGETLSYAIAYDVSGRMTRVTHPSGYFVAYVYDSSGNILEIYDAENQRYVYTLDASNNRVKDEVFSTDGDLAYEVNRTFDELNRLMRVSEPGGGFRHFTYDGSGNKAADHRADDLGRHYEFDKFNRLISVVNPDFGEISYDYDKASNLVKVTNQNGSSAHYKYDHLGDLIEAELPATGAVQYSYDEAGNRVGAERADGKSVQYVYDEINRPIEIDFIHEPSRNITLTYDGQGSGYAVGKLTSVSDPSGSTTFDYNFLGDVTKKIISVGELTRAIGYEYRNDGMLKKVTYPSGRTVSYELNTAGQVVSIQSANADGAPQSVLEEIEYMPFGPASRYYYGNGLAQTFDYDLNYKLLSSSITGGGAVSHIVYNYDVVGNIIGIVDPIDQGQSQLYEYDAADRLIRAEGPYGVRQYTYDLMGNRLSQTSDDIQEFYQYDSESNQLTTVVSDAGRIQYEYGQNGQVVKKTDNGGNVTSFAYDESGRLIEVTSDERVVGGYEYNYQGQRVYRYAVIAAPPPAIDEPEPEEVSPALLNLIAWVEAKIEQKNQQIYELEAALSNASFFRRLGIRAALIAANLLLDLYDSQLSILLTQLPSATEVDVAGDTEADPKSESVEVTEIVFYGKAGKRLGEYKPSGEPIREYIYHGSVLVAFVDYSNNAQGDLLLIHRDHIGAPHLVTNHFQEVVWKANFLPFGERSQNNGSVALNARYPGQYFDEETGLFYNYYRDYDPSIGRYIQSDPIGFGGGVNTYLYAGGNPVKFFDPYGLRCESSGGITTCTPENELFDPISFPTPEGWDDFLPDDWNFHEYIFPDNVGNGNGCEGYGDSLRNALNNSPTNDSNPASAEGAINNVGPLLFYSGNDDVISYTTNQGIVNVTLENHTAGSGFVMRIIAPDANGGYQIITYGEGDSWKQLMPGADNMAREFWTRNAQVVQDAAMQQCRCGS